MIPLPQHILSRRVEPEGTLSRRLMFIGEAPAQTEVMLERPFVGRAGKEQDHLNRLVGLQRDDIYWTNVCKVRVPDDKISYMIALEKHPNFEHFLGWINGEYAEPPKGVNPEVKDHIVELFDEVDNFTGNVVVPLGNVPTWVLTGLAQITKRAGSILSARGHKVIPCVHPSAIIRGFSLIQSKIAILDLARVKAESYNPEIVLPDRTLRTYPSFEESMEYIRACHDLDLVGFDIECMQCWDETLEMSCFALAHSPLDSMSIPLMSRGNNYFSEAEEIDVLTELALVLESQTTRKVGQNIVFDTSFVYRVFGIQTNAVEDTMLAHVILFPDLKWKVPKGSKEIGAAKGIVGLDFLCRYWTREPYYKDEGKEWKDTGGSREKEFFEYNAKDAAVVMEILPQILAGLKGERM